MARPALLASLLALARAPHAGEDLAKRYPATLSWSESGLPTQCRAEDVWQLKSFALELGKDFELACGKSTVALGVHGTNVLWAVVFPDKPGKLRAQGLRGDGELVQSVVLRFAPAELGRLFPEKSVGGPGQAWLRARAERLFRRKLGHKWHTPSGNSTVVPAGITLVDVDTPAGERRFYELDANAAKLQYLADFEQKTVPPLAAIDAKDAAQAFTQVWQAFDAEYANFGLLPELDWKALGKTYEKEMARAGTVFDAAAVLSDMLANLEDLHVRVKAGEDWLPGYARERPLNAHWKGSLGQLVAHQVAGENLTTGHTADGIGYLNVSGLSDASLPAQFDAALEGFADTWSLVVDLRFNGGGDELLGRELAGRFLDEERVYSKNRYRNGPKHADLGPVLDRPCAPRGPWRYESPVVALWGQRTMSSAESLALTLAQFPAVTSMGDRGAGSSGNPRRLELECGIVVNLPRWHDMDPEGRPVEHAGVAPEVALAFPPEAFTDDADPVFAAALERLRRIPEAERRPGRRGP